MDASLYGLSYPGLEALLESEGVKPVHAGVLWRALYRDLVPVGDLMKRTDFPPPLQNWCADKLGGKGTDFRVEASMVSSDGLTRKFLLEWDDGQSIETVLMGYPGRFTACVSTQVGCAMGCVFCATGQMGFLRHLTTDEIVAQVVHVQRVLRERESHTGGSGLRNIVLMGMGEPLHNYDAVLSALEIVTDTRGLNLGPSRITLSTVGHVPGIRRLAEERQPYHLAVSLHGASQEERAALVPVAKKWPLEELMEACRNYIEATGRGIFIEWTLIAGRNDTPEQATALAALLQGLKCHVNMIPLNPTAGFSGEGTGLEAVGKFQRVLAEAGIPSTVRQRRGIDVAAGCGQLRMGQGTGN
jgi:23S rRNA (adenine2503-C2)-methyltransferase